VNFQNMKTAVLTTSVLTVRYYIHPSPILRTVKNVSICIPKSSVLTYCPSEANGYVETFTRIHNFYLKITNCCAQRRTCLCQSYNYNTLSSPCVLQHPEKQRWIIQAHPESKYRSPKAITQVMWCLLHAKGNMSPLFWKKELTECSSKW
jgi:hypothetical protein